MKELYHVYSLLVNTEDQSIGDPCIQKLQRSNGGYCHLQYGHLLKENPCLCKILPGLSALTLGLC